MRSHALLQLADNKSAASCCKLIVQTCYQQACWKLFQQIVTSLQMTSCNKSVKLEDAFDCLRKNIRMRVWTEFKKVGSDVVLVSHGTGYFPT